MWHTAGQMDATEKHGGGGKGCVSVRLDVCACVFVAPLRRSLRQILTAKLHLCQTDKSPSATITFPSKATSIFLVSSNVIAPEACWIGPGKGGLETAKSTSQQSSSNLGRNVITFEFNSFRLSFLTPPFSSLSTLAGGVSAAWNLGGELISHMASGNPPPFEPRADVLHFVSVGAYCPGLSSLPSQLW